MQQSELLNRGRVELRRLSLLFVSSLLTEQGFAVFRFVVGTGSHALRATHPAGRFIEVWVRSTREHKGIVFIPQEQLEPASHRYVAFVWLKPGVEPAAYLIPSRRWLDRSGRTFRVLVPTERRKSAAWGLEPDTARLEAYRIELTLAKLLHGT